MATHLSRFALGVASCVLAAGSARAARPEAGSATAERLKVPSGPSSVRGLADEPAVDPFYAQVDYQVPIELPAGYGGLSPLLALTYSGALGNGALGIGWSLTEVRIQRSTRRGVPRFDATDELELVGAGSGRLVPISATEYRIEGMGHTMRVLVSGSGFLLDDGKGNRYKLGVNAAARQTCDPAAQPGCDTTRTTAWLVEEQTNQQGERVRFQYVKDKGQIYASRITWGPSDVYAVDLAYEARTDQVRSYREGFLVVTGQRLKTIKVTAFSTERRAYQLAYEGGTDSATFPVSRLSGVTSTGVAGAGQWPALAFQYAAPAAAVVEAIPGIGTWRLNANGTTFADLDGDGAVELAQLASNAHSYRTNANGTFATTVQNLTGNGQPLSELQLQDLDGDSRVELVRDTGAGWQVYKFAKTQWTLHSNNWPGTTTLALKNAASTRFGDLNGDGLIDAIRWDNDGLKVHFGKRDEILAQATKPRIGGTVLPTELGRFQDANGDGLDDYILFQVDRLDVFIGRGDGTFEPVTQVAYPFAGSVAANDIELADLDRDGLIDLVRGQGNLVRWYRGKPDGSFRTTPLEVSSPEPFTSTVVIAVADTNGNGSQDVVWSSTSGMWRLDLAGTTTAGMLKQVTNGLGMVVTFDYASSHSLAVAVAGSPSTAWTSNVPVALPVPVKKTTALGAGEVTRVVSYSVRDGFWDDREQRFGGFLGTQVTTFGATAAETSTVITTYSDGTTNNGLNRVMRGKPLSVTVRNGVSTRLSFTQNTWTTMAVANLDSTNPLLRRAVQTATRVTYDDASPKIHSDIAYEYDTFGRLKKTTDSGRDDLTGDESVTETRYTDDDTTWMRDLVCEEKVLSTSNVLASHTQYQFGDETSTIPAVCAAPGKGWARKTQGWLGSENRWVERALTTYDIHGNPTSITEKGIQRRLDYDSNGLFALNERMTKPGGGELVWSATWDQVRGVPQTITDPNGKTTTLGYDELGRLTTTALGSALPHQVIEYDWTAPFPKTTTWEFDGALSAVTAKPSTWSATSKWRQSVQVSNGKGETRYKAIRLEPSRWIISDYQERDPNNRVTFHARPVFASALELSARPSGTVGDALAYDPLGRLISQTSPTGATRTYSYLAFERTITEPTLAPVRSVLDGKGRALQTERTLPSGVKEIVVATYDPAGRMTTTTLAGGSVVRTFTYDTLGRLKTSQDPDLGTRTLSWDDGDRLTQESGSATGTTVTYTYDALGRLETRNNGATFTFHYDAQRPGSGTMTNLGGRVAWIEEPTGGIDYSYDELGRAVFTRRRIASKASEMTVAYAASGLPLSRSYEDGFAMTYGYDPAGRLTSIGDLWTLVQQDAAGLPIDELAQNGVTTHYERDALGLTKRVTVRAAGGAKIYDVQGTRNQWNALETLADLDGVGLDQSATFAYDAFARLTDATMGSGTYGFAYRYDVLHNMTSRTVTGPAIPGVFTGTYRYGEGGKGPRQLTSIANASGVVQHTFSYDASGRQTTEDGRTMTFDGSDRLTQVTGVSGGTVAHTYGANGDRIRTTAPSGEVSYFFGDGTAERAGVREHDVTVGDRVIARVAVTASSAVTADDEDSAAAGALGVVGKIAPWLLALLALGYAIRRAARTMRRRVAAATLTGLDP